MIADPEGPAFIVRTVERLRYSDGEFVTHDPQLPFDAPDAGLNGQEHLLGCCIEKSLSSRFTFFCQSHRRSEIR
jgi:hypothetical protein